ncbi:MAG: cobalamin biosynthesis protein CobD [Bacteroidaceae bacterium]|nr:cobalamin biosynthesis protein CobD [Bacteroidaceae bacterium]
MNETLIAILPLLIGWVLDLILGDPAWLPHPVVGFGKMIASGEHHLNKGNHRKMKGALMAIFLIALVFAATYALVIILPPFGRVGVCSLLVFYCLAGTTLIREVRAVFLVLDRSLEEGRKQVARIVGRDTSELSAQEVRTAALETLAENLSDGVIAPLFWLAILGTPGMLAYKMVNTLDSMIGYRTERYKDFGCWAARIDDVANYIPARLTALLMVAGYKVMSLAGFEGFNFQLSARREATLHAWRTFNFQLITFIWRNGRRHASPNSGYPEAALAGILNCRFGGPHYYFGELFDKPFIGENDRELTTADMQTAVRLNRTAEVLAIILFTIYEFTIYYLW